MRLLKGAVRDATTGGRTKKCDKDFLDRLAAIFAQAQDLEQKTIVTATGLSKTRMRDARKNPMQKTVKKRSDSRTPEDMKLITDWVIKTARRSADKANTAFHPTLGPHHVFYKTWSEKEGYQLFKKEYPQFKFKQTVFNEHMRTLYWLRKPTNSSCLCIVCTNMQLLLQGLRVHQKSMFICHSLFLTHLLMACLYISCRPWSC